MKIIRWDTKETIHEGDFETIQEILEDGVRKKIGFFRAELNGAKLNYAKLNGAELNGAKLNYAELNGAELNGAKLNGAELNYAKLNGAELNGAKLNYAELNSAELNGAELNSAELNGAELNSAELNYFSGEVICTFNGGVHQAIATSTHIIIGCKRFNHAYWRENYQKIGKENNYTTEQVERYRTWIFSLDWLIAKANVEVPTEKAED